LIRKPASPPLINLLNAPVLITLKGATAWWDALGGGRSCSILQEMQQPQLQRGRDRTRQRETVSAHAAPEAQRETEWLPRAAKGHEQTKRRYCQGPVSTVRVCRNTAARRWLKVKIILQGHREKEVTDLQTLLYFPSASSGHLEFSIAFINYSSS